MVTATVSRAGLGCTVLAVVAGLACLPTGTARASTIESESTGRLVFRGAPGEVNQLVVNDNSSFWQREVTFRVSAGAVTSLPERSRCLVRGDEIDCRVDGKGLAVLAGDRDDTVKVTGEIPTDIPLQLDGGAGADVLTDATMADSIPDPMVPSSGASTLLGGDGDDVLSGGRGDDELDGGAGVDQLDGGVGQDRLVSRDRAADTVGCGPQDDRVAADLSDVVDEDCESVDRADVPAEPVGSPSPPGQTTPPTQGGPPAPAPPPHSSVVSIRVLRASRRSIRRSGLRVRLRCPGRCDARLSLASASGPTIGRGGRRLRGSTATTITLRVRSGARLRRALVLRATVDVDGGGRQLLRRQIRLTS